MNSNERAAPLARGTAPKTQETHPMCMSSGSRNFTNTQARQPAHEALTSPISLSLADMADEIALHAPDMPAPMWERLRVVAANLRGIAQQVNGLLVPDSMEEGANALQP